MPSDFWKNVKGISRYFFQIGLKRSGIKSQASGELEVRNAADSAFAVMRGADPVGDNDFVTKQWSQSIAKPMIVVGGVDGNTTPTATSARYLVVTSNGTAANIGDIWRDNGTTVSLLTADEGRTIAVTDAVSGTVSFDADSIYIWDADGTAWVKIGDIGSVTGALRVLRVALDNSASQDSTSVIPANARILSCSVDVEVAYSAGATIAVGNTSTANLFMETDQNDPQSVDRYVVDQDTSQGVAASVVRVTVSGSPVAGSGVLLIQYAVANN